MKLIEDIKTVGGETMIFSSMHESGQRESPPPPNPRISPAAGRARNKFDACSFSRTTELDSMTGIAAILTYPLDIEVVEEEERQEKLKEEEEERKGEEEGGTVNGAT